MKNLPHLRFWSFYIPYTLIVILSIPIYWLVYLFRQQITFNKKYWIPYFFWLMLNDESHEGAEWWLKEKGVVINNDTSYFKRVFYAYKWSVFRNGAWNFMMSNKPLTGKKENIEEIINYPKKYSIWTWRNYKFEGSQYVKYTINDVKYFRYSFTNKWINIMYGYDHRLIVKIRIIRNK